VDLNTTLSLAGIVGQLAVVGLLIYRRTWRLLPFFCVYCLWCPIDGTAAYIVLKHFPVSYLTTYIVGKIVDSTLEFCVLVELAWSVFRPVRASLPRRTIWILGSFVAIAGAVIWPFTHAASFAYSPLWHFLVRLQQTVSILRVIMFFALAGCSQLLSISWRDRELQVATGLGFYSLAALMVTVLEAHQDIHQAAGAQYQRLDQLLVACYLCSLLYWVFSFAQKEAARREFTPQIQGLLLAMAGAARTGRIALVDSRSPNSKKQKD
jgi:hypothetical protein